MPRPIHFEIHAADPERVQQFYGALFGWSFTPLESMPYHLIRTGTDGEPGIDGGLVRRMGPNPDPQEPTPVVGYVCTVNVDDLDASVEGSTVGGSLRVGRAALVRECRRVPLSGQESARLLALILA